MIFKAWAGTPIAVDLMGSGITVVPVEVSASCGVGREVLLEESREVSIRHIKAIDFEGAQL
ncbi:MAG: hypothetical protein RL322_636 [Pseudomonadota bacterium]|jgi:hypothetical protein